MKITNNYKSDNELYISWNLNRMDRIISNIVTTYYNEPNNLEKIVISILKDFKKQIKKKRKVKSAFQENKRIVENIIEKYTDENEFYSCQINKIVELYKNKINDEIPFIEDINRKLKNGIPTPVLFVCGKGTQEIRYTKYLAFFLNYKQNHGLNKEVFNSIFSNIIKQYNNESYDVETEKYIGSYKEKENEISNICDIVISSKHFNIFIEQKIHSSESINIKTELKQLERYDKTIDENFTDKKNFKIYLTPDNQYNISSKNWINLTHKEIITKCFGIVEKISCNNMAKYNLLSFISDLCIGPYYDFDIVKYLTELTNKILIDKNVVDILKFKNLVNQNKLLTKLLLSY